MGPSDEQRVCGVAKCDETGTPTVLDTYGATNPAEFFAVVTEAFFERPRALRAKHPELYAELARFFRQDPSRYSAKGATTLEADSGAGYDIYLGLANR